MLSRIAGAMTVLSAPTAADDPPAKQQHRPPHRIFQVGRASLPYSGEPLAQQKRDGQAQIVAACILSAIPMTSLTVDLSWSAPPAVAAEVHIMATAPGLVTPPVCTSRFATWPETCCASGQADRSLRAGLFRAWPVILPCTQPWMDTMLRGPQARFRPVEAFRSCADGMAPYPPVACAVFPALRPAS